MIKKIKRNKKKIFALLIVFFLALNIRLLYQEVSETDNPLRADAYKYFSIAYNLKFHNTLSDEAPNIDPPTLSTSVVPGYPVFLSNFLDEEKGAFEYEKLMKTQAVLGALTAVFIFLITLSFTSLLPAFIAGIFTAFSPHLIAMDGYVLTESLFTFILSLGTLIFTIGYKKSNPLLLFGASIILTMSGIIRKIGYLSAPSLLIILAIFLLGKRVKLDKNKKKRTLILMITVLIGFGVTVIGHKAFVANKTSQLETEINEDQPTAYIPLKSINSYFSEFFTPANFVVNKTSHIRALNGDKLSNQNTELSFSEAPMAYIKWVTYKHYSYIWDFDNAYNGDVYIYPMNIYAFHDPSAPLRLKLTHGIMKLLHWPLFLLTIMGMIICFYKAAKKRLQENEQLIAIPITLLLYTMMILTTMHGIPRYSIPLRGLSYIIAVYAGLEIYKMIRSKYFKQIK
jgi:4-amino-4-deoxy-L-arabinose transferase-like glycosyltransferase